MVLAIEPCPDNIRCLITNVSMNKADNKVIIVEGAAGKKKGVAKLYIHPEESGRHGILHSSRGHSVKVRIIRLDELVTNFGLQRIDYIKVDVEGAELDVLRGAEGIINKFRPPIVVETKKEKLVDLSKLLKKYHYTIYSFPYGWNGALHLTAI